MIFYFRIKFVEEGKQRKLVIYGAMIEDMGTFTAKTNADETSCYLGVRRKYIDICYQRCSFRCNIFHNKNGLLLINFQVRTIQRLGDPKKF